MSAVLGWRSHFTLASFWTLKSSVCWGLLLSLRIGCITSFSRWDTPRHASHPSIPYLTASSRGSCKSRKVSPLQERVWKINHWSGHKKVKYVDVHPTWQTGKPSSRTSRTVIGLHPNSAKLAADQLTSLVLLSFQLGSHQCSLPS